MGDEQATPAQPMSSADRAAAIARSDENVGVDGP